MTKTIHWLPSVNYCLNLKWTFAQQKSTELYHKVYENNILHRRQKSALVRGLGSSYHETPAREGKIEEKKPKKPNILSNLKGMYVIQYGHDRRRRRNGEEWAENVCCSNIPFQSVLDSMT